jgi:rod shape-determining protein MreC
LLRAWYVFLALGLLTFIFTAFLGQAPYVLSSAVALPTQLPYRLAANLRQAAISMLDRRALRLENQSLQSQLAESETKRRQLELDLERLEDLMAVREAYSPGAVSSLSVIGISPGAIIKEVTLAGGQNRGIRPNMPVTTPQGLVGLVTEVLPHSSRVRAITDPQSRVGVTVRGRGGQGVAVGIPGGRVRVLNFIEDETVRLGDVVETSSRGGFFPRGITIGTVVELPPRDPNNLRSELVVEPAVDVTTLLEVVLIEPQ